MSTSQLLLLNNADPSSQDLEGKPPLIHAYINELVEPVAHLWDWYNTTLAFKDYNFSSPLLYAAAYGHDAIIDILILHDEVVYDWALQGWKEETLDEALKENNPDERNVHSDIGWDLNTGRMPQAHPVFRGQINIAALLPFPWTRLQLDANPVTSAAAKPGQMCIRDKARRERRQVCRN